MHSHLALEVEGLPMALLPDTSVNVNDQNPLFNQSDMFTYPFEVPFDKNRQILKNVDDVNSDLRPTFFEKKDSRLIVEGLPIRSGCTVVEDASVLDNRFRFSLESNRMTFQDMIGDLKCNEVAVDDDIVIGEMIEKVKVSVKANVGLVYIQTSPYTGEDYPPTYGTSIDSADGEFTLPALGFSCPAKCVTDDRQIAILDRSKSYTHAPDKNREVAVPQIVESYINVSMPYDLDHPYCNARVCYMHRGYDDEKKETTDAITEDKATSDESHWPYWVLGANRQQSGICFYIAYFLRCLFKQLGLSYDDSALTNVADFNRLAFFTTKNKYTTRLLHGTEQSPYYSGSASEMLGTEKNPGVINQWFASRGCGGRLSLAVENKTDFKNQQTGVLSYWTLNTKAEPSIDMEQTTVSANIVQMLATGENFPDVSVSDVIESIENSFGARFIFDSDMNAVKVVLLRDVFRSQEEPIPFLGEVLSMNKVVEKYTGFRMCYDSEADKKEQKQNVIEGKRDYDTNYDYVDYPQERTVYGEGKDFGLFSQNLDPNDMNVYIDIKTGNAYRVKIDSEAKTLMDAHPVLFEVGAYKGVEIGDCSETNSDGIYEMVSHFQPMTFNDVNVTEQQNTIGLPSWIGGTMQSWIEYCVNDLAMQLAADALGITVEQLATSTVASTTIPYQLLAAYIDDDMEHEFVKQVVRKSMTGSMTLMYLDMNLELTESYDVTNSDNGESPLQKKDWGLAVAMMRGAGADSSFRYFDFNYDGFGNSKWATVSGTYQMASDTMDSYGTIFDYNGDEPGVVDQERFSLKIRAYKQPEWAENPLCVEDAAVRQRGLFDTFMAEFAHFILNRKLYRIEALCTAAQLADIPNHWMDRYIIDGKVGYINKLNYSVNVETGLSTVKMEFYAL